MRTLIILSYIFEGTDTEKWEFHVFEDNVRIKDFGSDVNFHPEFNSSVRNYVGVIDFVKMFKIDNIYHIGKFNERMGNLHTLAFCNKAVDNFTDKEVWVKYSFNDGSVNYTLRYDNQSLADEIANSDGRIQYAKIEEFKYAYRKHKGSILLTGGYFWLSRKTLVSEELFKQ